MCSHRKARNAGYPTNERDKTRKKLWMAAGGVLLVILVILGLTAVHRDAEDRQRSSVPACTKVLSAKLQAGMENPDEKPFTRPPAECKYLSDAQIDKIVTQVTSEALEKAVNEALSP